MADESDEPRGRDRGDEVTPETYRVYETLAFAVIAVLSAARITRLLTFDAFPPIKWLREKYEDATDGSPWQTIAYCPWCMGFWVMAALTVWAYAVGVVGPDRDATTAQAVWWGVNWIFGGSYVASMVMVRDGDDSREDD